VSGAGDFKIIFMKRVFTAVAVAAVMLAACDSPSETSAVNVIIETDLGNDVDDALALGLAYNYGRVGHFG